MRQVADINTSSTLNIGRNGITVPEGRTDVSEDMALTVYLPLMLSYKLCNYSLSSYTSSVQGPYHDLLLNFRRESEAIT